MSASVQLRLATFDDYEQIMALESRQHLRVRSREDWTRLWRENPLYNKLGCSWPIGWVLEDDARRIVGTLGNIPVPYVLEGRKLIVATGRAWAVDERYRSVALMLMDEYFRQSNVDLFLNTTVNAQAAEAFGFFGSSAVPAGDWSAASYWVTEYRGFARAAMRVKNLPAAPALCYPASAALFVRDRLTGARLPAAPRDIEVREAAGFDDRFNDFWETLSARSPHLLGTRTREVLEWHFGAVLERGELWVLTVEDGTGLAAYAIFQRRDETNSGLRRMRMVDFQALADVEGCMHALLQYGLEKARERGIHVVEKVGRSLWDSRLIDRYAPYRRKLPSWPFYFLAPDPELHQKLQSPELWRPSSFDGDASL